MTQPTDATLLELKKLLDQRVIGQAAYDAAVAGHRAQLTGNGAIAQGDRAIAAGSGGVAIGGDNTGIINLGVLIQAGTRQGASPQDLRRAYLARIVKQANHLPLVAGGDATAQVRLSSVYTALLTQRSESDPATGRPAQAPEDRARHLSALDVLNTEPKLVLLGGPGSGKSTFVNFVALSMAGELLGMKAPSLATLTAPVPRQDDKDEEPEPQHWDHGALLPVQVILRDLASQLPPSGHAVNAETVLAYLRGQLKKQGLVDFIDVLHEELLQRGGLVLFDGLDEVPDALDRRDQIKRVVQDFAATFSKCRFLVTSRTYAYQRQGWKLDDFSEVQLLPFTTGQINGFVDAWYAHMVELERLTRADANGRAEVLKHEVNRNERLRELAERPLLLTMIAQLQTEGGGNLPQKREELYDKAVEMLLIKWESMKVHVRDDGTKEIEPSLAEWLNASRDDIRKQLNRLAFEAHRDQPQLAGTADIAKKELIDALLEASTNPDVKVRQLEAYLRDRAGILSAHGEGWYQFPHRSFQEYLAACHLTDDDFPDKLAGLARADANRWREVALLAGAKAARGSSLFAWGLSEALCPKLPPEGAATEADHWGALLAGRVLVESADLSRVAERNVSKLACVREWQRAIMRRNTLPAVERALAGRTLAVIGDPRPEVMTIDGMEFCFVPAGAFVMGADEGLGYEKPEHVVDLPYPYFIARFPVTLAQWHEHLNVSGGGLDNDVSRITREFSLRGRHNEPVANVTWHDAMHFCEQLSHRWNGLLPDGYVVTLPSEPEWEKAARGGTYIPGHYRWLGVRELVPVLEAAAGFQPMPNPIPRRTYSWGDSFDADKANTESIIGETSAVGCYPTGVSPYGCEDMSGNVWEWTRSVYGAYPYATDDPDRERIEVRDDVYMVVRGGSWNNSLDHSRCAYRFRNLPNFFVKYLGFRVVLRSAPVSKR